MTRSKKGKLLRTDTRYIYRCGDCRETFESRIELVDQPFLCEECTRKRAKKEHRRLFDKIQTRMIGETESKEYSCPVCACKMEYVDRTSESDAVYLTFECPEPCTASLSITIKDETITEEMER